MFTWNSARIFERSIRDKLPTELLFTDSKVGLDFESSSVILPA